MRPRDFKGKTTYNGATGRELARRPSIARWHPRTLARWVDRPSSHAREGHVTSTTLHYCTLSSGTHGSHAGPDAVCETDMRQTAVDDTHVATGHHRVVDALG